MRRASARRPAASATRAGRRSAPAWCCASATGARSRMRARSVERELDAIDRACSRFRDDSELSRLNARAGTAGARRRPLLCEALELALRAAELTDGDVDPTVGRALELAGYDRDWRLLDAPRTGCARARGELVSLAGPRPLAARARSGWRAVGLDAAGHDRAVAARHAARPGRHRESVGRRSRRARRGRGGRCGALVCVGGDIATCGPPPRGGWLLHVTDDHRSGPLAPGQTVTICSGGLATSSTAVRRWSHRGARDAPHHRPAHAGAGRHVLAHGQRRSGRLRAGQHRCDRRARARRSRRGLARSSSACRPGSSIGEAPPPRSAAGPPSTRGR